MYIHSINLATGQQKSFPFWGRAITLTITKDGLIRDERTGVLHFRYDRYNLFVTDRGSGQTIKIAGQVMKFDQPKVWLSHQELAIGDSYLLTWELNRAAQNVPVTHNEFPKFSGSSVILLWSLLRTPSLFFNYLTTAARRRFGTPLERISPWLATLVLAFLVGGIIFFVSQAYVGISATIKNAPIPTLTPTPSVTPPSKPTVTPTPAPLPMLTQIPTVVLVVNRADVVPSATNTPTMRELQALTPVPCKPSTLGRGQWDERLDRLGIEFTPACVQPGEPFWHLVEAKWLDAQESNGYHYVFVDILNEEGIRVLTPPAQFIMSWTTGQCARYMQDQSDVFGFGAHCAMFAAGSAYDVWVDGLPSDTIRRLGLGSIEQRDWSILTSFQFKFQRTVFLAE